MFSKPKPTEQTPTNQTAASKPTPPVPGTQPETKPELIPQPTTSAKPQGKVTPSLLSNDLTIKGNISTSGDIQIEGNIEGDVSAHLLTVGETATIHGEVIADDVVVNGRVVGRVRGLKVRLTTSARVEGDIVHKTIAIESGAHFEGTVQRSEDPLGDRKNNKPRLNAPSLADTKANDHKECRQ